MKLVVTYSAGDGCTWWSTEHIPVEYDSVEKLKKDLTEACTKFVKRRKRGDASPDTKFKQTRIELYELTHNGHIQEPSIRTLEEWFQNYR